MYNLIPIGRNYPCFFSGKLSLAKSNSKDNIEAYKGFEEVSFVTDKDSIHTN